MCNKRSNRFLRCPTGSVLFVERPFCSTVVLGMLLPPSLGSLCLKETFCFYKCLPTAHESRRERLGVGAALGIVYLINGGLQCATIRLNEREDVMARNREAMAGWSGAGILSFTAIRFRHLPASVQGTSKRHDHQPA
jgi:hypothetical protein